MGIYKISTLLRPQNSADRLAHKPNCGRSDEVFCYTPKILGFQHKKCYYEPLSSIFLGAYAKFLHMRPKEPSHNPQKLTHRQIHTKKPAHYSVPVHFNYINTKATYAKPNNKHKKPITTSIGLNMNFTAAQ